MRLAGTLGLAGLLSGLLIVGVYEATLPRIQRNQRERLEKAVLQVVPSATTMQKLLWRDGALQVAEPGVDGEVLHGAYDDQGRFRGYAIAASGGGFQDTIDLLFGFDPSRRVITGLQILASRETPGLGDKIFKDPVFADNFKALAVEPEMVLVPKGTRTESHQVDGITGATISSKAVVRIIAEEIARWLLRLPAPGGEPPLQEKGER